MPVSVRYLGGNGTGDGETRGREEEGRGSKGQKDLMACGGIMTIKNILEKVRF